MTDNRAGSVQLRDRVSGSTLLHDVLAHAVTEHPDAFHHVPMPDAKTFRKHYVDLVPRFEAARVASPDRAAISGTLAQAMQDILVWHEGTNDEPLNGYLSQPEDPVALNHAEADTAPGWIPGFDYDGQHHTDLSPLADLLLERNVINQHAATALQALNAEILTGSPIDLTGRKIVIIGAAAEMAATRQLAATGADILWLDQVPPSADWLAANPRAGRLSWPSRPLDLLTAPREALATIAAFADGDAVDLCLYAYAPGQAREVRLTGVMNALVNALPESQVASVTMLVSPTTPAVLDELDLAAIRALREQRPAWQSIMDTFGLLGGSCIVSAGNSHTTRTVVSIQGTSYQAAQYLGKLITAEAWANEGRRVSANTAAITKTRSLDHPVFAAAFGGAAAFNVETFSPAQSQEMNGLLAVHDWLAPGIPVPGRVRVHGGIHTLPYPIEITLRTAAAIGFARRPLLLAGLLRG